MDLGYVVRVEAALQRTQQGMVVEKVVGDEDQHDQFGAQAPGKVVVVGQLMDLAEVAMAEG